MQLLRLLRPALVLAAACASAAGQAGIQSPGMPRRSSLGQASQDSRFDNSFNPAIGAVIDARLFYHSSDREEEGFDLSLSSFELSAAAFVDPSAWAYAVLVAVADAVELEEAAGVYVGFDANYTLKAGRFFVDFGKQMQLHEHDLRTFGRPLPLAAYLGEELAGEGLQFDNWFAAGDSTLVRYSVGAFASLVNEFEQLDGIPEPVGFDSDRKQIDEFALTARLTSVSDVGEFGQLQLGTSARLLPDYGFEYEPSGSVVDGLSNTVFGLDVTYSATNDTATRTWTVGGEALLNTGDIGAVLVDPGTPGNPADDTVDALNDDALGFFVFANYAWNLQDSVTLQLAHAELPEPGLPELSQVELYYDHFFSDFHRLRFGAAYSDYAGGDDALSIGLQYTLWLGPHSHGANW